MNQPTTMRAPARLRSSADIAKVLDNGRSHGVGSIALHVLVRSDDRVRLTAVASRRVGTAVRRNRAKRLIREAGRRIAWRPGVDVVAIARPSISGLGLAQVEVDLRRGASALGVGA